MIVEAGRGTRHLDWLPLRPPLRERQDKKIFRKVKFKVGLSPEDIEAASALTSGKYNNFGVAGATLDGREVALIVALVPVEDEQATYIQPLALICDDELVKKIMVNGLSMEPGPKEGAVERAVADEVPEFIPLLPSDHHPEDEREVPSGLDGLDEIADWAASIGGLSVHSTEDGGWCAHVGPVEDPGCVCDGFVESITHAVTQHAPSPGDPLLGPDDPRSSSHLN